MLCNLMRQSLIKAVTMKNIYSLTLSELENHFESINENKAKAKIIFNHLYKKGISSFKEIDELSSRVKQKLSEDFCIDLPKCIKKSSDEQVEKVLFSLSDEKLIEAVLMRQKYGNSVCISTQIGCNMACSFCESGKHKTQRNLTAGEMVSQLMFMKNVLKQDIKTVTIMGIGEPFQNYENVMDFIDIVTSDHGLGLGKRHVTVSTCGIVPKIVEYAKRENVNSLAVSLHACSDELRSKLMPINKLYPLNELKKSLEFYTSTTKNKVLLEYLMLENINDSEQNAMQLCEFCKDLKCTVNLIAYNETNTLDFKRSSFETIMKFYDVLKKNGVHVTIRREFGREVKAACGQLKSEYIDEI